MYLIMQQKPYIKKGANVLSNIGSKVHKLQEKAETAKIIFLENGMNLRMV